MNKTTNEIKEAPETGAKMIKANRLKLTVKLGELPDRRLVNGKGSNTRGIGKAVSK